MTIWHPPSDEEQMAFNRIRSGGHPSGEIIGKQDVITAHKSETPAYRKEQSILAAQKAVKAEKAK